MGLKVKTKIYKMHRIHKIHPYGAEVLMYVSTCTYPSGEEYSYGEYVNTHRKNYHIEYIKRAQKVFRHRQDKL